MDYYEPTQVPRKFVYNSKTNKVNLKYQVDVLLKAGETLARRNIAFDAVSNSLLIEYSHTAGPDLKVHLFTDEIEVEVLPRANVQYDPNDQEGFITRLRPELAPVYKVNVVVRSKPDGTSGSQATTSIQNDEALVIV